MAITLKEEVIAKCTQEQINTRDCHMLAQITNVGRKKPNNREIGYGSILETIGITSGNTLIDTLLSAPSFKYVKPLLEQGRLVVSSPLVSTTLQSLVPSIITQDEANKIIALGLEDNPCTPTEVGEALYNPDGSIK